MKNYKIITTPTTTRYVLESATAGATSAGSVASTEQPIGSIITREADKNKVPQKPRQGPLRPQTGGGKHKDKKRAEKQGDVKHKKPFMEDHEVSMASNELKSIHANAKKLLALVQQYGEQGDIEAWQQSKITKAADYLNSVLQSIGGEQDALDELKGDPNRPDPKKVSHFQNLLKTQKDRFAQQGFARAADDTDKLQKKYREPISELDKPSGTMFLKFMKKQLPDREMALYAFAGFGNTPDDVRAANAKIKPFIVGDVDELEYNVNKIFRDVDFVGVEKMVVDPRNVPDGMMPDVEALVDLDDRLEFYVDDSDDDEEDGGGGKMQHYVIGPDGKKRKVPVPGKPSAQVAGSSHNTPVQPKTYKYTLQRTELMPKLRDMGFKFQGNQIILSKQQRDQLVQKLGSQFQSIFSQSDKFTEAGNERNKQNPTRDFLRRYPVPQDQMVRPVKKPEKKKPEQGVAEGSEKNVVKSVKVGNFRHDLVDTGMGWQVRIYNGGELYDTGMSKNSEQKGLAALEDAVAYTEKLTRTKRQGVAEDNDTIYKNWRKDVGTDYDTTLKLVDKDYNPNKPRNVADELAKMNKKLKSVAESEKGLGIKDMVMDQYYNGRKIWEIAQNLGMSEEEVQDIINNDEQGVAEGSDIAYVVSYFEKITGDKGETTVSAISPDKAAEKVAKDMGKHGYPLVVYHVRRAESVAEGIPVDAENVETNDYYASYYADLLSQMRNLSYTDTANIKNNVKRGLDSGKVSLADLRMDILDLDRKIKNKKGVAEGAPELLKQEMPLVRHIEKELEQYGYIQGTAEYDEKFKHAIAFYRKFGNIDAIKQSVAEAYDIDDTDYIDTLYQFFDLAYKKQQSPEHVKYWMRLLREPDNPGERKFAGKLKNALKLAKDSGKFSDNAQAMIAIAKAWRKKHLQTDGLPDELSEAEKLKGVSQKPFPKDELIKYLDRVVGEPVLDKEGKPKLDKKGNPQFKSLKTKTDKYKFPYIHRSNVPIVNQDGQKYDLDKLASLFTERPSKILKQNEKMQHSDGTASQFYNVGLPALIGLAVDEDNNEFVVINTCPGAGNCKLVCYAMKGGYIQYPASNLSQTRLLNFLYNDPDGFMGMLENEIAGFEAKNSKKNIKTIIRWHDAGDFFSPEYLDKAYNLAKKFPDVDFYAYTKLASVAQGDKPDNFKINFSMGAQPSQEKKIDFAKTKNSRIVPEVLFADLLEKDKAGKWQYKNSQAQQAAKDRIAAKYSLDPKSIITYDEMMKIPVDKDPQAKGKWNVIVKPGDGDDAANRNDVLSSLLLIH